MSPKTLTKILEKIKDPTPLLARCVPFVNEDEVQIFCERYLEKILGLKVIASSRSDKRNLFDIDVLAVDADNTPFIIECKQDLIDNVAIGQLRRYRKALLSGWSRFEDRVSDIRRQEVVVKKQEPVLVALGYSYEASVFRYCQSIISLRYAYHHVAFEYDPLKKRPQGKVSLQRATVATTSRHPPVQKRDLFLNRLPLELKEAFSALDCTLRELDGVTPKYVKDSARYRLKQGYFAEAKISSSSILWSYGDCTKWTARPHWKCRKMSTAHDVAKIMKDLCRTHGRWS